METARGLLQRDCKSVFIVRKRGCLHSLVTECGNVFHLGFTVVLKTPIQIVLIINYIKKKLKKNPHTLSSSFFDDNSLNCISCISSSFYNNSTLRQSCGEFQGPNKQKTKQRKTEPILLSNHKKSLSPFSSLDLFSLFLNKAAF